MLQRYPCLSSQVPSRVGSILNLFYSFCSRRLQITTPNSWFLKSGLPLSNHNSKGSLFLPPFFPAIDKHWFSDARQETRCSLHSVEVSPMHPGHWSPLGRLSWDSSTVKNKSEDIICATASPCCLLYQTGMLHILSLKKGLFVGPRKLTMAAPAQGKTFPLEFQNLLL